MTSAKSALAARDTVATFKGKECKIGRARIFGGKTIGMDDPGMIAIRMMLDRFALENA